MNDIVWYEVENQIAFRYGNKFEEGSKFWGGFDKYF